MFDKTDVDRGSGEQAARQDCNDSAIWRIAPPDRELRRLSAHAAMCAFGIDELGGAAILTTVWESLREVS
jgi:hypothetical protein